MITHAVAQIKEWGFAAGILAVLIVAAVIYLTPDWLKRR